jgi:hypothetical protein
MGCPFGTPQNTPRLKKSLSASVHKFGHVFLVLVIEYEHEHEYERYVIEIMRRSS